MVAECYARWHVQWRMENSLINKQFLFLRHGPQSKKTPLHLAASKGQLDVTALLVDLGSDMYALDSQGQTPMMLAIENDHSEIVKLFLRRKPDLATMSNAKGFTCAHIAAMKGSTSVIKELMKFNKSIGLYLLE